MSPRSYRGNTLPALLLVTALAVSACSEVPTTADVVSSPQFSSVVVGDGVADLAQLELCKIGTDATFDVTVDGTLTVVSLADGECQVVGSNGGLPGVHPFTVTEQSAAGITLDSIVSTVVLVTPPSIPVRGAPITGTSSYSSTFSGDRGVLLQFYNSPVEAGCTLTQGFWKTHTSDWPAPYSPSATFFTSGKTWIQLFNTAPKGDAYIILAHQYMAALLNGAAGASTPANVQTAINTATGYFTNPGGSSLTRDQLIALATLLDSYNNGGQGVPHCPDDNQVF